jgi:catechol 2,3-dioxygenase-like lactoylglutathione lyase family enzyme
MKMTDSNTANKVISPNGVHHLAISTADMGAQIDFFCNVLGGELRALYWMHGAENTFHGFVRLNDHSYVAFVQPPEGTVPEPVRGVSHPGGPVQATAGGTLQHLSFNVDTYEHLEEMRDRIRSHGYNAFGPVDHGFCQSIYFSGPEGMALEVATSAVAIDSDLWIDPEVAALVGLDDADIARLTHASPFHRPAEGVAQPPRDASYSYMGMDEERYQGILDMSDQEVLEVLSETTAPGRRQVNA